MPQAKWVRLTNMHLTLHFLGDISEDDLAAIIKEFKEPLSKKIDIIAKLGELGVFPNWDNPRILWLSLQGNLEPLYKLHKDTSQILAKNGYTLEKRGFRPHITLARIPSYKRSASINKLAINEQDLLKAQEFRLNKLTLYTSKLTSAGPIYTEQHTFLLQ